MYINSNFFRTSDQPGSSQAKLHSGSYTWGTPIKDLITGLSEFDSIVASDVVYDPQGYKPLYDSICFFLTADKDKEKEKGEEKIFILAHRQRHPDDYK